MQKINRVFPFQQVAEWVALGLAFLSPLLLLPFTDQFFLDSKKYLLMAAAVVIGFLYIASLIRNKVITFALTPLTLPLFLFGVVTLASSLFSSSYPVENLLGMGGVYLAMVIIVLFGSSLVKDKSKGELLVSVLAVSGILLTLSSFLQFFGFGPSRLISQMLPVPLPNNLLFNLSGSSLIAVQFLGVTLVGLVSLFFNGKKFSIFHKIATLVVIAGLIIHGWSLLPNQPANPTLLPFAASWSVGIDVLKAPKSALIGFGPEGFANAFNQFKPQWMNGTKIWNVQFSQGSDLPFSLLISTGVLGLATWLLLAFKAFKETKDVEPETQPLQWMLLATLVGQLILPPTAVLLTIQTVILLFWVANEQSRFSRLEIHGLAVKFVKRENTALPLTNHGKMVLYGFSGVLLVLFGFMTYGLGRAYAADFKLFQATVAAQKNDAVSVYNLQREAVSLNPYLDRIRRRYGITNLTIAAALSQKADRTDDETKQFSQLVQQAIREGRAATLLDPSDTNNWRTLAQIYRSLVGAASGADQWAVTSYVKAIETSPGDPQLRIELGGILYAQQNYNEAARFFQQAINLKPDQANAYYNLANAYVQMGRYPDAKVAYQQTLLLVEPDSQDYLTASAELEQLNEKMKTANPESTPASGEEQPSITSQNATQTPSDAVTQPLNGGEVPLNKTSSVNGSSNSAPATQTGTAANPAPASNNTLQQGSDL